MKIIQCLQCKGQGCDHCDQEGYLIELSFIIPGVFKCNQPLMMGVLKIEKK